MYTLQLQALTARVDARLSSDEHYYDGDGDAGAVITRERHRMLVATALEHLDNFHEFTASIDDDGSGCDDTNAGVDFDLVCAAEELRLASRAFGAVLGHVDADRLLDIIFADFCIGK
jgi:tRNA modification GTPase